LPDRGVGASGVQHGPPIVQIIVGTRPLVTVDRGRQPLWTMGWHDRGREERSCRRSSASGRLPIPGPTFDGDVRFDARDPSAVFLPIEPLLPSEGVKWAQIDVGAAAEDLDHLITPKDRYQIAMARR
jgi:hypothetical protein